MTASTIPRMARRKTGLLTHELTAEHKAEYVRLIYDGHRPDSAAREIGSTGTQFRRLRNPRGLSYDPDFAQAVDNALVSQDHHRNHLERIRDAVWAAAEQGNAKLLEKLSLIHDPDWEPLRHQNLRVDVQMVARVLPYLTDDQLQEAIQKAEAASKLEPPVLRALPSGE